VSYNEILDMRNVFTESKFMYGIDNTYATYIQTYIEQLDV